MGRAATVGRASGPEGGGRRGYGDKLFWLSVLVQRRYAQICAGYDLTPMQATLLCAVKDEPKRRPTWPPRSA